MVKTTNQTTHSTRSRKSLPKSALSPTEQAVNALLEVLTKTEAAEFDYSLEANGKVKYAYGVADRIKAAEIILKYAPEKRSEIPSD